MDENREIKAASLENLETVVDQMEKKYVQNDAVPAAVSFSIPITGWAEDETADYPNYYDLPVTGVTARDRVEITLAPYSLGIAAKCGLCKTCETLAGKIRLRSVSIPSAAIAAEYWIEKGR